MENRTLKRRGVKDDDVGSGSGSGSDRISQLPEFVLHHILCFLSQKKAVQTCVLSKSWRHLGLTRPVIDLRRSCDSFHVRGANFCENCFRGNKEAFLSVLDKTFQRYHDQNLSAQVLRLEMLEFDLKSIPVLEKWIPMFINPDTHVTTFRLSIDNGQYIDLPSVVFKAESLRELHLKWCRLDNKISFPDNVMLKNLQKLSLSGVTIAAEAVEKIIAGCPLVESVVLCFCTGFQTININANKNRYLSYFDFSSFNNRTSIAIDAPTLQSIRIRSCSNWYRSYFPHLKSLFLSELRLSTESIDNFSCNFPCLEELRILHCYGFEKINLFSCSIKHLIIRSWSLITKIAIDVPNILYFEFSTPYNMPTTFSLRTTSREWKSHLNLHDSLYDGDAFLGTLKLFEMVKALSQSQISLRLSETIVSTINQIELDFNDHPVVVEHLGLNIGQLSPESLTHSLNALFRIFRPRYTNAVKNLNKKDEEPTEFLWKTLIHEREKTGYGWEQHLEEVSIEAFDEKGNVWRHIQWTCLPGWSKNQKIRFRLKWRD